MGGNIINEKIIDFVKKNKNAQYFKNLGHLNYLSLMKWSTVVIGNSSSGIIEAPSLRVPTINIGERQLGREKSSSILNCKNEKNVILKKCKFILQKTNNFSNIKSPYERKFFHWTYLNSIIQSPRLHYINYASNILIPSCWF